MQFSANSVIAIVIVLPGLYAIVCVFRRIINAKQAADWVRLHFSSEWDSLHWVTRHANWAGVETLISKGLISGPEVERFRLKDEHLERATWVGLFISAALLFLVVFANTLVALSG